MKSKPGIYNLPSNPGVKQLLTWMGKDYVQAITDDLYSDFIKNDPNTEFVAIKFQNSPEFESKIGQENEMKNQKVTFDLQVLLKDSQEKNWRLNLTLIYFAEYLAKDHNWHATHSFNITSQEQV